MYSCCRDLLRMYKAEGVNDADVLLIVMSI